MQRLGIGMALAAAAIAALAGGMAGPANASASARMIAATVAAQPAAGQLQPVQVGTRAAERTGRQRARGQRRLRRHCAGSGDHIYRYPRCYGGTCFRLRYQDRRAFFYPRQHGKWWRNPGCAR